MLVIIGASGKLGFATLTALVEHQLLPSDEILCTTSSDGGAEKLQPFAEKGVKIVRANWDDSASWEKALAGANKLFLISSSRIDKDFGEPYPDNGSGREGDHFVVLEAAKKLSIEHVYYTSLGFQNPSKSRVMEAHVRTEAWLHESGMKSTIIREGLYNESWPLYFGHYDVPGDDRDEVLVAGDGPISWTSIADLGLATALILSDASRDWAGKTFYLSQRKTHTLSDIAHLISTVQGKEVKLKVVSRPEHETYYAESKGMDAGFIKWWSRTYDALRDNECDINDPTLEHLLSRESQQPLSLEETIRQMLG